MGMQSDRKRYKGRRGRWEWEITSEDEQKEKEEGGRRRKCREKKTIGRKRELIASWKNTECLLAVNNCDY